MGRKLCKTWVLRNLKRLCFLSTTCSAVCTNLETPIIFYLQLNCPNLLPSLSSLLPTSSPPFSSALLSWCLMSGAKTCSLSSSSSLGLFGSSITQLFWLCCTAQPFVCLLAGSGLAVGCLQPLQPLLASCCSTVAAAAVQLQRCSSNLIRTSPLSWRGTQRGAGVACLVETRDRVSVFLSWECGKFSLCPLDEVVLAAVQPKFWPPAGKKKRKGGNESGDERERIVGQARSPLHMEVFHAGYGIPLLQLMRKREGRGERRKGKKN